MSKAEYKSSIRSKKMITDALVALLDEKPLDKITVSDIVKKADINRGTFYAHYANVSDVVTTIFEGAFETIKQSIQETNLLHEHDSVRMLQQLQFVVEQDLEFFRKVYSADINLQIYEQISIVLTAYILDHEREISNVSHTDFVFYTSFFAGGIMKLYRDWFIGTLPISFDELTLRSADLLNQLKYRVQMKTDCYSLETE